jgi:3-isopropylmalate/(R)-2-methylmalate dehydratase large subunit
MGMTMTEKILAAHAGVLKVRPGELVNCQVDLCMANDVTAALAIKEFRKIGINRVFDPEKIVLVPSHYAPSKDIQAAAQVKVMRDFAKEMGIKHFFELGRGGIEHILVPEQGLAYPGMLYVGADSHTCTVGALGCFATGVGSTDMAAVWATGEIWLKVPETMKFVYTGKLQKWVMGKDLILATIGKITVSGALYRAMEFTGPVIHELPMSERFTMCNMVIEAGGKNGIMPVDEVTLAYLRRHAPHTEDKWLIVESDPDAQYHSVWEINCSELEPLVAFPHSPDNVHPVSEAASLNIAVDQVFIGSCTNAKLEDLRIAAQLLKGRKVHPDVRLIVIPATHRVYMQAMKEGLLEIFADAGAIIAEGTCGPCLGGYFGVLGPGERCLSTSNRNFIGRMGSPQSEAFLANPAVAAATAVLGRIAHPDELDGTPKVWSLKAFAETASLAS